MKVTSSVVRRLAAAVVMVAAAGDCLYAEISDAEMNAIYEEVKTPYKYGVILAPEKGKMFDSPCVFRCDGCWLMYYVVYDGQGYETHVAESDDLLSWRSLGVALHRGKAGEWDAAQSDGAPVLFAMDWNNGGNMIGTFNGKCWMPYIGGGNVGYEADPLAIGMAWTDNLGKSTRWSRLDVPVLAPWDADARWFERKTLYRSFVVDDPTKRLGHRFVMYYNAKQEGAWVERIGMAVSNDMEHWKRYGVGPCIANNGERDRGICGDPMIRIINGIYVMFFFGYNWEGDSAPAFDTFAASKDLVHWTRWTGPNLLEASESWDKTHAHKPWVLKHDGIVYHFYCAVGDKGRVLALATSKPMKPLHELNNAKRNMK